MRRFLLVPLIAAWLASGDAMAAATSESDVASFLRQVEAIIEDPIPPVSEVVPGYPSTAVSAPGVVVADPETRGDVQRDWGRAIGQILRWELLYADDAALRGPDFNTYYEDAAGPDIPERDVGRSVASAALAANRLGFSHLLTGIVTVADGKFDLDLSLRKAETGDAIEAYRLAGPLDELPQGLNTVLQQMGATLGRPKTAGDGVPFSGKSLARFAGAFADNRAEQKVRMQKLWLDGVTTPLTAAHRLRHLDVGSDLDGYFERLEQIREMFPGERGIEFAVARYVGYRDRPRLFDTKVARLKKLMAERPHDPTPMLVLCDTLAENNYTLDAIAVCREALLRHSGSYRAWWSMGASLLNHAWQLRGTGYWNDVSAKGQRQYPKLKEFGGRAMDMALALNDHNSGLWSAKMWAIGQYSPEFMAAFETAIRLDPTNRKAYELAVNYTLPQWGGSIDAQDDVLALARKHIADDSWHEYIQRMYVGERPFWHRARRTITSLAATLIQPLNAAAALLLVALAGMAVRLRTRNERARSEQ